MSSILRRVCLYLGEGADKTNAEVILKALKHYLRGKDVDIGYITPEETIEGTWKSSTLLYVIGGGYDLGFIKALGDIGTQQIKDYVLEGGSYLGLCAGGYFASDYIEFDKDGPLEVCGERKLKFYPGMCVGPVYGPYHYMTEGGAKAAEIRFVDYGDVSDSCSAVYRKYCLDLKCYFNGGGMFVPYSAGKPVITKVYKNENVITHINNDGKTQSAEITENGNCSESSDKEGDSEEKEHVLELKYIKDENWCQKRDRKVDVQVLANYEGVSGSPACIVKCRVGKGVAVLTGPHMEYDSNAMNRSNVFLKQVHDEIRQCDKEQNLCFGAILKHLELF